MEEHSPECSEISVSASAGYMLEPASVKRDDIILTAEVLYGVTTLKFPGYQTKMANTGNIMVTEWLHH